MAITHEATIEDPLNYPDCGKEVILPPMTWCASRMYNETITEPLS
jgi:hypothetical protein